MPATLCSIKNDTEKFAHFIHRMKESRPLSIRKTTGNQFSPLFASRLLSPLLSLPLSFLPPLRLLAPCSIPLTRSFMLLYYVSFRIHFECRRGKAATPRVHPSSTGFNSGHCPLKLSICRRRRVWREHESNPDYTILNLTELGTEETEGRWGHPYLTPSLRIASKSCNIRTRCGYCTCAHLETHRGRGHCTFVHTK